MTNIILEPHQQKAKEFLMKTPRACLFFEARGGKTYPTVESILELVPDGKILILAPKKAKVDMWDKLTEYKLPKNTLIINFESAIGSKWADNLLKIDWDVIIVDECHKVKSHNAKISKLCQKLTKKAKYVWGLTGTPKDKSDVEVVNIFRNLNIGDFGKTSYSRFNDKYMMFSTTRASGGRIFYKPSAFLPEYVSWWEEQLDKYSMIYNLPDSNKNIEHIIVNIDGMLNKHYEDAVNHIIKMNDYEDTLTKVAALNKAHQASNGHIIVDNQLYTFMVNKKLNWVKEFTKNGKQGIITYKFIADRQALLTLDNVTLDYDEFKRGDKQLLLLQSKQSMGFDCSNADYIIFYTMDYGYIDFNQMWHRIINLKKMKELKLYFLINTPTESGIYKSVNQKHIGHEQFMTIRKEILNET